MFESVLVANRGEIAVRVMRTLSRLGVRSIAVYSDADAGALHVRIADHAERIGPASAAQSYLNVDAVMAAALASGAQAIHPGYGFLSENPALARACEANGIVFVGPPVAAMAAMGDKIAAKATVAAAGVPTVPGSSGSGLGDAELAASAEAVGYPILIKPSAGGGGKGMRLVEHPAELQAAIDSARREARNAFGDHTLLIERFLRSPRHIEIQVLADTHGNVVHLGERECSLQRRHQKIVEEAPSPLLSPQQRAEMGRQAVEAARSCGYVGAGTVEFIVSGERPDEFFFMEMNTRLQVEHPVTEMVYGIDLVEQQLLVAAGEPLQLEQPSLEPHGHAIEARVYAEDPQRGFLPTGGTVRRWREPVGDGVRVDSGITTGSVVGSDYDPMLAKLIAWGPDRRKALARLDAALAGTAVMGVTTNIGFLRRLLGDPDVDAGRLDTGLVERRLDQLVSDDAPIEAVAVAALAPLVSARGAGGAWTQLVGWRHGGHTPTRRVIVSSNGDTHSVTVAGVPGDAAAWELSVGDADPVDVRVESWQAGIVRLEVGGRNAEIELDRHGSVIEVWVGGSTWTFHEFDPRPGAEGGGGAAGDGVVRSPMPGTLISLTVTAGEAVTTGQAVAVVEAMKMEHTLTAPFDGVVVDVAVAPGAAVALDAVLLTIEPSESREAGS